VQPIRAAVVAVAALAAACSHPAPLVSRPASASRSLVVRNVHVFDAPAATRGEALQDVVVRDGRIAAIAAPGTDGAGLPEIDGKGGTLLPGLVDAHTHTGASAEPAGHIALPDLAANLAAYLYAGVTTVLDLGGLTPAVFRERADVASGATLGPRVLAAGPMFTAPGGHPVEVFSVALPWYLRWYVIPRAARQVATPADATRAVQALLPDKPDIVKLAIDAGAGDDVPRLAPATIAAIAAAAHQAGLRSIAHVGTSGEALDAVRAGVDALAHAPWREELSDDTVAAIAAKHVPVVVTLAIWDVSETAARTDFLPIEREVAGPDLLARLATPPTSPEPPGFDAFRRAAAAAHAARRRNVAKLRAAGVTVLAGSDACNPGQLPGAGLHLELAKLVEAGLTPGEALRAATAENARFIGGDGADFGTIAPGKRADLLLVAGDPVARIADLRTIAAVIRDGVPLERHPPR